MAAPRFSRTPGDTHREVPDPMDALREWGVADEDIERLQARG